METAKKKYNSIWMDLAKVKQSEHDPIFENVKDSAPALGLRLYQYLIRYKAPPCIRWSLQIDNDNVYAPTTRAKAVRCLAVLFDYKSGQEEVKDMHRCNSLCSAFA